MAKKNASTSKKRRRVAFSIGAPGAAAVSLLGDFNNWKVNAHPMKNDSNGNWNKTLMLHPGRYEYKFLIDGVWQEDPLNPENCPNCFGTRNNVMRVISR